MIRRSYRQNFSEKQKKVIKIVVANNAEMICCEYKQSNSVTARQSQNNEDLTLSVCLSKKMYRRRKLGFVERKYLMESPDLGIG